MKKTGRSDADGAVSSVAGCIRETVRRHRLMSLLLAAAIAGSVVLSLLPPLVLERIIDSLAEGKPIAFSAAAGYFLITAVSGLLDAGKETMITASDPLCDEQQTAPSAVCVFYRKGSGGDRFPVCQ